MRFVDLMTINPKQKLHGTISRNISRNGGGAGICFLQNHRYFRYCLNLFKSKSCVS
jgi:hypothetical protein